MTKATSAKFHPDNRLNRREAAEYIGVTFNTLTCWASAHKGPPFYKTGKGCRYLISELDAFLESRRVSFEQLTA